jgi:hypothetical protein
MIKITSQNPVHKHIFTTLLHGVRYDVSVKLNTLYKCGCNNNGSFSRKIENAFMIKKFVDVVNDHVITNKIIIDNLLRITCIDNSNWLDYLTIGKVYTVKVNEKDRYQLVADDLENDFHYSKSYFEEN